MRDTLDLEVVIQQGQRYRKQVRRGRVIRLATIAFILVISIAYLLNRPADGEVYRLHNGDWQRITTPFSDAVYRMTATNDGSIWALTRPTRRLYRYDGNRWHRFYPRDYGIEDTNVLAISSTEHDLWIATQTSLLCCGDDGCQAYQNVLPNACVAGIAVVDSRVMVVDCMGMFIHYDGITWQVSEASSVLPAFSGIPDPFHQWPTVVTAPNGHIWMSYYGIWRFNGSEWSLIYSLTSQSAPTYSVLHATDEAVWVMAGTYIMAMALDDGSILYSSHIANDSYERNFYLQSMVVDDRLLIATEEELQSISLAGWKPVPLELPNVTDRYLSAIVIDSEDSLWITTIRPAVLQEESDLVLVLLNLLIQTCGFPVVLFVILYSLVTIPFYARLRQRQKKFAIRSALRPEVADMVFMSGARPKRYRVIRITEYTLLVFVVLLLIYLRVSFIAFANILFILILIWLVLFWRVGAKILPADKMIHEAARRRLCFLMFIGATTIVTVGILATALLLLSRFVEITESHLITAAFAGIFLGLILLPILTIIVASRAILRRVAKCDYEGALQIVNRHKRWIPWNPNNTVFHALVHIYRGSLEEADTILTEHLPHSRQNLPVLVSCIHNLGLTSVCLGKHEKVMPLIESCTLLLPEGYYGYLALAAYYLNNYIYSDRALEITEYLMQVTKKPRTTLSIENTIEWVNVLSLRALAIAAAGDFGSAEEHLQRAFEDLGDRFLPLKADLHRIDAIMKQWQNDQNGVIQQLKSAYETDPHGLYGNFAKQELANLGSI